MFIPNLVSLYNHLKICQHIPILRTRVGRGDKQNKDQERKN